jgi:hypothetical protein
MHEILVYSLDRQLWNSARDYYSTDLFTLTLQSDPKNGLSLNKAYALRAESVTLSNEKAVKVLKFFTGLSDSQGAHRGLVKALKKIHAVKIVYDNNRGKFLPKKYQNMKEVYFESLKNNLELIRG